MAKLRRTVGAALADDSALRLRAAWLYHGFSLTQSEVADQLGIGRSTVIRLLEEARQRGEVKITIEDRLPDLAELSIRLERALSLDEAIVVPAPADSRETGRAVGLALGRLLSDAVTDGMTIGVGWGRTLSAALESFSPPKRAGVKVMSLMGGAVETQFANPFEFAWRLATALQAGCFLFPAPLLVGTAGLRDRLMGDRGIARLKALASSLDLAVVSAGGLAGSSGSLVRQLITDVEAAELLEAGAVADIMCNFINADGRIADHPINARVMSVGVGTLKAARHKVLASGGNERARAILAVVRAIGVNTLVTDEHAARAILEMA
ncbi:MAG: sugar-binding transcriptional regulator [Aestuariivirga sp.]|uniref:sugar-binding transcriptional regulator n=1 Tax=Aestuariivirga sp. TaxID=2650926 RepID=UPI0025B9C1AC|nr:sugar-binding transcriptional regulator [Aestuariivirga sp.]MCA3559563.1 sugar-binding transcriptional regulator [Aestuariivirga sp.]